MGRGPPTHAQLCGSGSDSRFISRPFADDRGRSKPLPGPPVHRARALPRRRDTRTRRARNFQDGCACPADLTPTPLPQRAGHPPRRGVGTSFHRMRDRASGMAHRGTVRARSFRSRAGRALGSRPREAAQPAAARRSAIIRAGPLWTCASRCPSRSWPGRSRARRDRSTLRRTGRRRAPHPRAMPRRARSRRAR